MIPRGEVLTFALVTPDQVGDGVSRKMPGIGTGCCVWWSRRGRSPQTQATAQQARQLFEYLREFTQLKYRPDRTGKNDTLLWLHSLPEEKGGVNAARPATDGAGRLASFWHVTVPGVRPATVLVLLLATVTGANLFTEPYLLTGGGGPNGASSSPVFVMYQQGIQQGKPGYAAAIGMILVILVLIIALLQNRFVGGRDR